MAIRAAAGTATASRAMGLPPKRLTRSPVRAAKAPSSSTIPAAARFQPGFLRQTYSSTPPRTVTPSHSQTETFR